MFDPNRPEVDYDAYARRWGHVDDLIDDLMRTSARFWRGEERDPKRAWQVRDILSRAFADIDPYEVALVRWAMIDDVPAPEEDGDV